MLHAIRREEVLVLGDVLEDTDGGDDLQLREEGDGIPHLRRAQAVGHCDAQPRRRQVSTTRSIAGWIRTQRSLLAPYRRGRRGRLDPPPAI